jgi:hypothetical protein
VSSFASNTHIEVLVFSPSKIMLPPGALEEKNMISEKLNITLSN